MRRQSLFSDLKLRVSYGKVGNQAVDPYQSLAQLGVAWYSSGTTEIPAMAPGSLMPNPDLHWEEQTQFNVGLDAALVHDRVAFTIVCNQDPRPLERLLVPVSRSTAW